MGCPPYRRHRAPARRARTLFTQVLRCRARKSFQQQLLHGRIPNGVDDCFVGERGIAVRELAARGATLKNSGIPIGEVTATTCRSATAWNFPIALSSFCDRCEHY